MFKNLVVAVATLLLIGCDVSHYADIAIDNRSSGDLRLIFIPHGNDEYSPWYDIGGLDVKQDTTVFFRIPSFHVSDLKPNTHIKRIRVLDLDDLSILAEFDNKNLFVETGRTSEGWGAEGMFKSITIKYSLVVTDTMLSGD